MRKTTTKKTAAKKVEDLQTAAPKASAPEKVLVVIPYYLYGAQGEEIRFALMGWRKYFKTPHKVVVIGDEPECLHEYPEVDFIPMERAKAIDGMYTPHLDFVRKFRTAYDRYHEEYPAMIWAVDDNYALRDFDVEWVMKRRYRSETIKGLPHSENAFSRDKFRTRILLIKEHLAQRDYTTHIPYYFEWDKLMSMFDKYEMDKNSYVIESLYYNLYPGDDEPELLNEDTDSVRRFMTFHIPREMVLESIYSAFDKKVFLCNATSGWSRTLEAELANYYGICIQQP